MFKKKLILTALSLLSFIPLCQAGTLTIVNNLNKPFNLKFEPQGKPESSFMKEISAEPISTVEVTFPQLSGTISYAIRADLPFKIEEKCLNLNVEKDYRVVIEEKNNVITCRVVEMGKGNS